MPGGRGIFDQHEEEAVFLPPNFPLAGLDVDTPEQLGRADAVLTQRYSQALELERGDLVSLVGAGGKTSLLEALASEQAADGKAVLATTTTHVFRPSGKVLLEPHDEWLPERVGRLLSPGWCLTVASESTQVGGGRQAQGPYHLQRGLAVGGGGGPVHPGGSGRSAPSASKSPPHP